MSYTDRQRDLLRDALRAYHDFYQVEDHDYYNDLAAHTDVLMDDSRRKQKQEKQHREREKMKSGLSWAQIYDQILEVTGVAIGSNPDPRKRGNTLQKFVSGVSDPKKPGNRKEYIPSEDILAAIKSFVTHEDIELLSGEEIDEASGPPLLAPLKLAEYLATEHMQDAGFTLDQLEGRYRTENIEGRLVKKHELILKRPTKQGVIEVFETMKSEDDEGRGEHMFAFTSVESRHHGHVDYVGWAIVTPEDNLFFFLKESIRDRRNRYFFMLASDFHRLSKEPVSRLVLLQHDLPFELDDSDRIPDDIRQTISAETKGNIVTYYRLNQS